MRGLRLYLIGGGVMIVLYLLAQFFRPQPVDWAPTFLKEDKIPFGLYILNHELESIFPAAKIEVSRLPPFNTLEDDRSVNSNYLWIADKVKADPLDYKQMVSFMNRGNRIFIAAADLGDLLSDTLHIEIKAALNYNEDRSTPVNFVNPALKIRNGYTFNNGIGERYFSKIDTLSATVLGKNEKGEVNFVRYKFGKGALYILPDAKLLSNYNFLRPKGAEYASKVLSYLPVGSKLIFDEYQTRGSIDDSSILRVLIKYDQLRWAYILSISAIVLFVLFEMKRRQRIIPVTEPLTNTSVEFAKLVGKVYYQQHDNLDLAHKIVSYFLERIRSDYRLSTSNLNEELIRNLTIHSGAKEETIRELFQKISSLYKRSNVTDDELIGLNKLMEEFQKQVR